MTPELFTFNIVGFTPLPVAVDADIACEEPISDFSGSCTSSFTFTRKLSRREYSQIKHLFKKPRLPRKLKKKLKKQQHGHD